MLVHILSASLCCALPQTLISDYGFIEGLFLRLCSIAGNPWLLICMSVVSKSHKFIISKGFTTQDNFYVRFAVINLLEAKRHISVSLVALQSFGPWLLFQFLKICTVVRTPRTGDRSIARPLPTHRTAHTQNKHTIQTSMHRVRIEPPLPVFLLVETVNAFDHTTTGSRQ
jgi:hypothetical protein